MSPPGEFSSRGSHFLGWYTEYETVVLAIFWWACDYHVECEIRAGWHPGGNVDAELATVISTAATTLVRLLATDGWERAKTSLGSLWRRAHPDQPDAIDTDLADSRAAVLAARDSGNEQAERDLESEWRGRLRYLVAAEPALIAGLSELVQDLRAALSAVESAQGGHIEMHAHASGHAQVFQAGRDQNIRR